MKYDVLLTVGNEHNTFELYSFKHFNEHLNISISYKSVLGLIDYFEFKEFNLIT